jgi:hypothetical protein
MYMSLRRRESACVSSLTGNSNLLPFGDKIACGDREAIQMCISGTHASAVVNDHQVACQTARGSGESDSAIAVGINRRLAAYGAYIQPLMAFRITSSGSMKVALAANKRRSFMWSRRS